MKLLKQLLFIGILISIYFSSCTTQNQMKLSGYSNEWFQSSRNPSSQDNKISNNINQTFKDPIVGVDGNIQSYSNINNSKLIETSVNCQSSSNTNNIEYTLESVQGAKTNSFKSDKFKKTSTLKNIVLNRKALKKKIKQLEIKAISEDDGDNSGLRTVGWIVLILGLLVLIFASILIGALLMLLGLIFVKAGGNKSNSSNDSEEKQDKNKYIDVVYLKNGSIIRGTILEQIPNVSIKIQTKDGSLFVYKMDDVEKITKEQTN